MKKYLSIVLIVLCCMLFIIPISAADAPAVVTVSSTRIDLEDGGYILEEIVSESSAARATSSKSGKKTSTRYNSAGTALYAVVVNGSFKYTGSSSWSTASSATVYTYVTQAVYVSKSASYASNYAKATGSVTYYGDPESRTVTLYCDKNGNLS